MAIDETSSERLQREYVSALREYVSTCSEAALTRAYELGRNAVGAGLGILDLALIHHEGLLQLPPDACGGQPPVSMAAQFLAESLSPFEMTLRSYRANARLLGLSEVLVERNAEIDRAREQLRTILDATTAVIYLKDAEGRYLYVNRQFQQVFGRRSEDVLGKHDDEVLPPSIAATLHGDDVQVLQSRAPHELEEIVQGDDGAHTYLSLKFPLLDAAGTPYGICCVATDITERKRAEEALQRAREAAERERQLKEALEARDQFISLASHELRTPVTSLELQVATFQRLATSTTAVDVDLVRSKIGAFARHVDRLRTLVNTLLDVARITSGRLELSREAVDLAELVQSVLARLRNTIQWSHCEIVLDAARAVVGVWDRAGLDTVVSNLVSNALKFGQGKPIEIAIRAQDERATLVVRDHGIGISADDQKRIFERFERAAPLRHFGGFGIGLFVARQAVEAHGGSISVRSEPGQGSEFTIELPLGNPPRPRS